MRMGFQKVLEQYRKYSFSERDKGDRFERLIQSYLQTDRKYSDKFQKIWLWNEFPFRDDLGGSDTGIDLVAQEQNGDYWAIQCKCYQDTATIGKAEVDSFLSTSSRKFRDENAQTKGFSYRLWVSTTNKWGSNAEEAIQHQDIPFQRLNLYELEESAVDWEALGKGITGASARREPKTLRSHQREAMNKTHEHFQNHDRGSLIMACGTGKTFASLRIAENETHGTGLILFLVPSLALLGQTLNEWTADAEGEINAICICSEPSISKKRKNDDDSETYSTVDLALPASTNVPNILKQFEYIKRTKRKGMTVVFSTYQSIEVIAQAQKKLLEEKILPKEDCLFDLIICDEAHRTTGVSLAGEDASAFIKVHDNAFLQAKKRLYMTATPRLYSDDSKTKAQVNDALLCSMDDVKLYGQEIYRIGFGEAVERGLLTDYKVLILTLSESQISPAVQNALTKDEEINTDDAAKLIGCINAVSKQILGDEGILQKEDPFPMKRAVAFCQNIAVSKEITGKFNLSKDVYFNSLTEAQRKNMVPIVSKHIDGSMNAPKRDELMSWLKRDKDTEGECKVLTNVRCLSEGVDVPSLDAVMFLSARNSQVDVVQSVGRVMRRAEGKKYGYIIIPIVIPSDMSPEKALENNDRYRVVWSVLNALRAHDDRFNATVNKIELNKKKPDQILVGGIGQGGEEETGENISAKEAGENISKQISLQFAELQGAVFAKMVQKVGDRGYWENWAKDVGRIAESQIERIHILITSNEKHKKAFAEFLEGLQKNINPSITEKEAVEMLSQHIITQPVFEALFEGYSFAKNNAISVSMQKMLEILESETNKKDFEILEKFYESVKKRAEGIDNAEARQKIIVELYDKFFKTAFPKMVEKLGIVYTPIECVDFIIHSVNDVLKKEFGRTISDENIHILDPFTGTGTFITRLLQSGLIDKKDLRRKYEKELHANEIVLLAYYIAAVNIENAFHDQMGEKSEYASFEGICLTDTFQLGESEKKNYIQKSTDELNNIFEQNSGRIQKQKNAPIRVIMGNPPYSIGQKSANDNAQNQEYENLNKRIAETYAEKSNAGLNKSLYDAYIKAFRWSSDRLNENNENGGIIAFISNGAWLDGNSTDGFRKALEEEFSSIYVFNLRGNQRTSGELSRKEGGKIFGSGSRTPISITLLVKNQNKKVGKAEVFYHDIGDYLSREEKLGIVRKFHSIQNEKIEWKTLEPNEHGDWINERNDAFEEFLPINPEKKFNIQSQSFFSTYSLGLCTNRDAFCYNSSREELKKNISHSIDFYNEQRKAFQKKQKEDHKITPEKFLSYDSTKLNWTDSVIRDLKNNVEYKYTTDSENIGLYRPYCKQKLYFSKELNHRVYQNKALFPSINYKNIVICFTGMGANKNFSTIISDSLVNLDCIEKGQCFPLYYYEEQKKDQIGMFGALENQYVRRDGVTDFILSQAKAIYGKSVTKEDIFYYVYGFLHSPEYKTKFANDLKKMLPRLPLVDEPRDFWKFSKTGRALADLHLNYESVPPLESVEVVIASTGSATATGSATESETEKLYKVEKMRFPKKDQKDTILFNSRITISNIPAKAYEYIVNGKSAIEWIMERYSVTINKESGIKNDPNDWAVEVGNPRYILDLLLSVIALSVQTVNLLEELPKVKF
jgi:predicted helicase